MSETLIDPIKDILILLQEIDGARHEDDQLDSAIIDLIISVAHFCMSKWSKLSPRSPWVGILLLSVQLQCLKSIDELNISTDENKPQRGRQP